jgi:hypothetical protein
MRKPLRFYTWFWEDSLLSRKDPKKKERQARKRSERLAAEEAQRQRARDQREMPNVLTQLEALFKDKASRAITMAFEEKRSADEISTALEVPVTQVEYLFDVAGGMSEDLLRLIRRWPTAFENPEVFKSAVHVFQSGSYKRLFRSAGL